MSDKGIGERLLAARKAAGYNTALAFCEKFQFTRSTYSQHEAGKRYPKDNILASYAEKLGVNFDWLKTGQGEPLAFGKMKNVEIEKNLQQGELVEELINKRFAINSLDEELLAELLEKTIDKGKAYNLNSKQVAQAATGLYNSLKRSGTTPENRVEMITLALNTYFEFYGKKS